MDAKDVVRGNKAQIRLYVEYIKCSYRISMRKVLRISAELVRLQNENRFALENGIIPTYKYEEFESKINRKNNKINE